MKFRKLRLAGFKSFVEATEFLIEPGLTGVVGPNGCGKSNLVEAMRWVMGETSYKNMRASGMEDVIFSGSGKRPPRNFAEVLITLDNADRTAPTAWNDSDTIEVTRRIERGDGSDYRINGREARARDVQLLFADASSGARSPAMVRQGQIGEIIAAKPQQRRRIIEEAAGVAGLHSRRHEAELRLKAAEDNLVRIDDIVGQLGGQIDGLRRQARQAERYRLLAAELRRLEALQHAIAWATLEQQLADSARAAGLATRDVANAMVAQQEAARLAALGAHGLPKLREDEAATGAALQRLVLAREALDGEARRQEERRLALEQRARQVEADLARERALIDDASRMVARFEAERMTLEAGSADDERSVTMAQSGIAAIEAENAAIEAKLAEAQAASAAFAARREALAARLADETRRRTRIETDLAEARRARAAIDAEIARMVDIATLAAQEQAATQAASAAEAAWFEAESAVAEARRLEGELRGPAEAMERRKQALETEIRTLEKLLAPTQAEAFAKVIDQISARPGYEAALAAALGDDLEASLSPQAALHWAVTSGASDPDLPPGAQALSAFVEAPEALHRRLAQIGVATPQAASALVAALKPGQRLVSAAGDLWRWDGLTRTAAAPGAAARRLGEMNRLAALRLEFRACESEATSLRAQWQAASAAATKAVNHEMQCRNAERAALKAAEAARNGLADAERRLGAHRNRAAALMASLQQLERDFSEIDAACAAAQATMAEVAPTAPEAQRTATVLAQAGDLASASRRKLGEAQARLIQARRVKDGRAARLVALARDLADWQKRQGSAAQRSSDMVNRAARLAQEHEELAQAPATLLMRRRALMNEIDAAEGLRQKAGDARVAAEIAQARLDAAAREAQERLATAREAAARETAGHDADTQRRTELAATIRAALDCDPQDLRALAGLKPGAPLPASATVTDKLQALREDRERLGVVNLRAEVELGELEATRTALEAERNELTEAIRRLRQAIGTLNREGRERLQEAFDRVNGHFRDLFTRLFNGGTAELQLIESDDPLEAGLEINARPPGKKPQTMTLLSGGEQALTAMALIFAVFLTNPSPICVLDEVDAPLDDSNVERFCDLLDAMAQRTETRFLTITHNPITMARMNRLYGVTMAEQGVSQLVSVDLAEATELAEAG
ncbi:MAG: chromosome segregation protein SMC [Hyphomicrobiales bacterium]|nr:chromosome segregation protein SMC [Hyphomicrobiales bacterium]